jgi:integrase
VGRIYQPRKGSAWYADYYRAGQRIREKAGTKEEAKDLLKRRGAEETLRRRGGRGQATNRVPIGAVKDAWLENVKLHCKPKTRWFYGHCLKQILDRIPARSVDQITPAIVNAYASARRGGIAALNERTINMHTGTLKTMLRWAADAKLIETNPLSSVKPLKQTSRHYRRALDEKEIALLLDKSPAYYRRIWLFMLGTGFRKSEVEGLKWADLDLERDEVSIDAERSKNNEAATIPLPGAVADMLRDLKAESGDGSEYVFVNQRGVPWKNNLRKRLRGCLRAAGIARSEKQGKRVTWDYGGVDLHALRVTYITHLVRAGVDIKTCQRLARHKRIQMTLDIYARSFPDDQRAAVERLPVFGQRAGNGQALAHAQSIGA